MNSHIFTNRIYQGRLTILSLLLVHLFISQSLNAQIANAPCNLNSPWVDSTYTGLTSQINDNVGSIVPLCIGGVNNIGNLIDDNLSNFTTINITGVGCNATIGVADGTAADTYPSGTWAGFRIGTSGLLGVSVASTVTVQTFNNGSLQQSQVVVSNVLGLDSDLLFADGTANVGFVTTAPFDEVRITFQTLVGVLWSAQIYHAVITKYCVGPTPACNTMTSLTQTEYPAFISDAGTTGVTLGSVTNTQNVVDDNLNNFGSITLPVGILSTGFISVKDQLTDFVAGTFAGFEVSNSNLLGVNLLQNTTVRTYLNGAIRETKSANDLLLDVSLLSGANRQTVGFITTLSFDEIRYTINQVVGVDVGTTQVYSAVIKSYCTGPALECNTQTALTEPDFPAAIDGGLTGISGVLCVGCSVTNVGNVVDASTSNFGSINLTVGLAVSGSIAVKDVITTYPAGTFAGFDIENPVLVGVNVLNGLTVQTYLDGVLVESSNAGTLVSVGSGLLTGSGRQIVGFVATQPFNTVRLTVSQGLALNLGNTEVYNAVLEQFCAGPDPLCNVVTNLVIPTYPAIISNANTGVDGILCVGCAVNNVDNVINSDTDDFASIVITAGLGVSASFSVKDGITDYPAGYFAGFDVSNSTLLGVDLVSNTTVRTYLNGTLQETQSGNGLLLSAPLLIGTDRQIVGFISTLPFDEIRYTINQVVGVDVGTTQVYSAVIKSYCAGPALECNTQTALTEPDFPATIDGGLTGISGALCVGCLVTNVGNVVDSSASNFGSINLTVGLAVSGSIAVKDVITTYPAGTFAGFDIENPVLVGVNVLNGLTVQTYLDGVLVESSNAGTLVSVGSGLLTGSGRQIVGFVATQPFNTVRLTVSQGLALNLGTTEVYKAVLEQFCAGPDPLCNVVTNLVKPTYPVFINNTNTGIDGILCVGCALNDVANVINDDTEDFATIVLTAGVGISGSISVKDGISDYDAGAFAGFEIENTSLLYVNLLNGITIRTYLNGTLQETKTGVNNILTVESSIFPDDGKKTVGLVTTLPFDEVRISVENIVGVNTGETKVFRSVIKNLCAVDLECDETYFLSEPTFPVIINSDQTGIFGVACVACSVNNSPNVISEVQTDFATITVVAGVLATGDISVQDPLSTYPAGSTAGFVIEDTNTLIQADLFSSINICTYLDGVEQECQTAGNLIELSLLGIWINPGPGIYNVGFVTSLPFDEVKISVGSLASVINVIRVYSAFVDTRGANDDGFDCCPTIAPALSASEVITNCPSNTFDLTTLETSTAPGTSTLVWFTNDAHTGLAYATPTAAVEGTYYSFYYNANNDCYSPSSDSVVVNGSFCDTDGDGDPDNTDPDPIDPCVYGPGQVLANVTMLWRNSDCDGDGVTNWNEVAGIDGDPLTTGDNTNPLDPCILNLVQVTLVATSIGDCDGDGVTNANEINGLDRDPLTPGDNTDPLDPCDYNEADQIFANTTFVWRAIDCDGDGNPNGTDPNPLVATALNDVLLAPFGTTSIVNVLANDDYLPGVNTSLTAVGGTYVGAALLDPLTGELSYVPAVTEPGTVVTLIYQVCNVDTIPNVCSNATVTITIPPAGDTDGDGDPDNTDPDQIDPCVYGPGQVLANATMLWRNSDCDGDGVTNWNEVAGIDGDPLTTGDNTDPLDPCSLNLVQVTLVATSTGDCDGDGVTNANEINGLDRNPLTSGDNTDPNDPCDYNEADQVFANTTLLWRAIDCDGDGNPNGTDPNPLVATAANDVLLAPFGTTSIVNVLANDDYLPGVNTSLTVVGGTYTGAALLDPLTGELSYVPAITEPGTVVTLIYQVCNLDTIPNVCSIATVTITVPPAGDTDGDGDPDNTDPDPIDPCVYGPGQVLANATMLWRNSDCDGDGVTNWNEVVGIDGDPLTSGDNTDPLDPCSLNLVQVTLVATSTGDCDGDGVTNANEINGLDRDPLTPGDNTDPNDPCDYNEADQIFANTTLVWRAIDCDGDGNPNGTDPNPLVATALNDILLAPFGTTSTVNVLANDDYLPGVNTSLTAVGGTYAGAALLDPLTGVFSYVPAITEPGTVVTLIYQVCNLDTIPNVCSNATVTITVPESCVEISTKVLLEGPYNSFSGLMTTTLNNLRYLPGQDPVTFFGQETPAGQPYNVAPWNYNGSEGDAFDYNITGTPNADYPTNTTDWVLVSLRTGINSNTTVCTKAALVFSNGTIQIPSGFDCCDLNINETYYVVIEHRNHLIVMSHVKVPIVNGVIYYDFTNQDSYKTLLGFGQKNVGGKWVMYAGNGQQVNSSSADTDINVNDKDLWLNQNGQNSSYFLNDLDLNGDVNVQDKNVWLLNNGKFSDVPRN